MALAPDDPLALYYLGIAASREGASDRALELWSRLRKQVSDDDLLAAALDAKISEISQ